MIGPRRAGKTTFLWQVLADRLEGGLDREGLLYFNFEDERLAGWTAADLALVVEEYYRLHPERRDRRGVVLFSGRDSGSARLEMFAATPAGYGDGGSVPLGFLRPAAQPGGGDQHARPGHGGAGASVQLP